MLYARLIVPCLLLALATGCHSKIQGSAPRMNLEVIGRYQSVKTELVTAEPLRIKHKRDGKKATHWLIPHPHSPKPAQGRILNSSPVQEVSAGVWHVNGTNPMIETTRIKSVGLGTIMVVEVDPGTDPDDLADDIHRVYFLGPQGHGVDVYKLPWNGGRPDRMIRRVNEYVELRPDGTLTNPAPITGELAEFIEGVLALVQEPTSW